MANFVADIPPEQPSVAGGLFAHIDPVQTGDSRVIDGVEYTAPVACNLAESIPDWCTDPRPVKTVSGVEQVSAAPFSAYQYLRCGPFGRPDLESLALNSIRRSVMYAAEQTLVSQVAAGATPNTTAMSVSRGLGEAERVAAILPGGHIYLSRSSVPLLGGLAKDPGEDGTLYTVQHTPLVNMLFDDQLTTIGSITPTATQFWIFVTGTPRVWLGESLVTLGEGHQSNDWDALAEQVGAVGYDCAPTAILVEAA